MIHAATLLKELKAHLPKLEDDIRLRLEDVPEEKSQLESQYTEVSAKFNPSKSHYHT
jgi:hypothetical protein